MITYYCLILRIITYYNVLYVLLRNHDDNREEASSTYTHVLLIGINPFHYSSLRIITCIITGYYVLVLLIARKPRLVTRMYCSLVVVLIVTYYCVLLRIITYHNVYTYYNVLLHIITYYYLYSRGSLAYLQTFVVIVYQSLSLWYQSS